MLQMLTELMSGLALFLFGMKFMSESLQKAAGDKMRGILNRVTKNKITAVLFGALFTAFMPMYFAVFLLSPTTLIS